MDGGRRGLGPREYTLRGRVSGSKFCRFGGPVSHGIHLQADVLFIIVIESHK